MDIQELRNEIKIEAAESATFEIEAFARVFARHLEDSERLFDSNIEVLACRGPRGRRLELIGYSEDSTDETLTLIVGRYFGSDETLTLSEAKEVAKRAMGFLEHSLDGWLLDNLEASSRELEYAEYFSNRVENSQVARVKIIVLTDGVMSDRIREIDSEELQGLRVSFEIWDQKRVLDAVIPELGSEDIVVDFTQWLPKGLPCLVANSNELGTQTILAVLPAKILAAIFDEYGSLLLESNVRTFLSARGKVNSGIQGTLAHDPAKFLAYNNGLTTTAREVDLQHTGEGSFIKRMERWQIVNGGQTTASISHYLRGDKSRSVDNVFVQMKLVKVDPLNSSEIVQSVAKYANSQNLVSAADLFSTHEYHVRMEVISRRLRSPSREGQQYQTGWYYERARGQWENDRNNAGKAAAQKNFELEYPRSQRITKTDWAKYRYSWEGKPHLVSRGAQSVFSDFAVAVDKAWEADDTRFAENYFQEGVALAIIYEELRSSVIQSDWYKRSPGYLANIVTYGVARFSKYIRDEYPNSQINLGAIWKSQRVSEAMKTALVSLAKLAQAHLNDPDRPQANVTQWAKQQACWDNFARVTVKLDLDLSKDLISRSEATDIKRDDRKVRQIDSSLEAITVICEIDTNIWDQISNSLNAASASPMERDLVKLFSYRRGVPSERQARALLRMVHRMQNLGLIPYW